MSTEERLRQELHRASATLPPMGVDFEATVRRGRSARHRSRVGTLAAAIVVLAGAGVATVLARSLPGADVPPVLDAPPSSTPAQPEPTPSPSASAVPGAGVEQVEPVLRTWLEAIQDGDEERVGG